MRIAVPETLARAAARPREGRRLRLAGSTMGMEWSAQIVAPPELEAGVVERAVQAELDAIVAEISHWEPTSALGRFNDAAPGELIDAPAHLCAVLANGLDLARESDGAFDPAIGALVDLWGFGPQGPIANPPTAADIAAAREVSGWRRLRLEGERLRQPGGLRLDLSGIGKGYGVDRAAEVIAGFGVRDFLVEIGGELRGGGVKPDGTPWWVIIEPPPGADGPGIAVALHELAVATSGDWRRFLLHDGRRRPHTLDPRSGAPIETGVVSVSVLHASAMHADAACTVLSVLPADQGLAWAEGRELAALITVARPGGLEDLSTRRFQAMLDV